MKVKLLLALFSALSLSSCNLLAFMDKPSGDIQLLEAARLCLDKGDYTCARDYYQALSNSYADVKISETSLTTLAENNIFFMSDLFDALGSGAGGPKSLISLAELAASRGKTNATTRTTIQTIFQNESAITDVTLRAYSQLISSLSMFNSILAAAVGANGKLEPGNIASNPSTCAAGLTTCSQASLCVCAACGVGNVTTLTADAGGTDAAVTMDSSALWTSDPSYNKLSAAASKADAAITTLTSTGGGMLASLQQLSALGPLGTNCKRQVLIQILFPEVK